MKKVENYRPHQIEFTAESEKVPSSLGEFESVEEAREFMAKNFVALNQKLTAQRFMDAKEIEMLREEYSEELEEQLPKIKKHFLKRVEELERAKELKKEAEEQVNASLTKIQDLAKEVNGRVTTIELDEANTWSVVWDRMRYIFTLMDGEIQLAHVEQLTELEREDFFTTSDQNRKYFENLKKAANQ